MRAAQPPPSCCTPYSAMLLACPKESTLTSPNRGNGERQPVTTVIFSPRTPCARRTLCSDSRIERFKSYLMWKRFWRASTPRGMIACRGGPSGSEMR